MQDYSSNDVSVCLSALLFIYPKPELLIQTDEVMWLSLFRESDTGSFGNTKLACQALYNYMCKQTYIITNNMMCNNLDQEVGGSSPSRVTMLCQEREGFGPLTDRGRRPVTNCLGGCPLA